MLVQAQDNDYWAAGGQRGRHFLQTLQEPALPNTVISLQPGWATVTVMATREEARQGPGSPVRAGRRCRELQPFCAHYARQEKGTVPTVPTAVTGLHWPREAPSSAAPGSRDIRGLDPRTARTPRAGRLRRPGPVS